MCASSIILGMKLIGIPLKIWANVNFKRTILVKIIIIIITIIVSLSWYSCSLCPERNISLLNWIPKFRSIGDLNCKFGGLVVDAPRLLLSFFRVFFLPFFSLLDMTLHLRENVYTSLVNEYFNVSRVNGRKVFDRSFNPNVKYN